LTNIWRLRDRTKAAREGGAVATEFALLMAFLPLTILACGIVDYGELMAQATNLSAMVRGAAEYARGQMVQVNQLPTASQIGALLNVPGAVFTTSSFCTCVNNAPVTCDAKSCPSPNGDTRVLKYVAVSGSQTFTPLISATWSFPATVNARTVLRTQ
jgi:Flp pilus assembly protein TadG